MTAACRHWPSCNDLIDFWTARQHYKAILALEIFFILFEMFLIPPHYEQKSEFLPNSQISVLLSLLTDKISSTISIFVFINVEIIEMPVIGLVHQ